MLAINAWSSYWQYIHGQVVIQIRQYLELVKKTEKFKEMLKLRKISDPWESKDAIHYAGQKLFTHCYNGRSNDTPSRQLFIQLKTYVKPIYLDIPGFAVNMI